MKKEYILESLKEMIPNPKCELDYDSDYTLLIAILLSAQTLDKNVNKITPILFNKYPTLVDLKNAQLEDLEQIIKPIGLSKNKSKSVKNLATILVDKYESKIPTSREVLSTLPGVGNKTSGVFLVEYHKVRCQFKSSLFISILCRFFKFFLIHLMIFRSVWVTHPDLITDLPNAPDDCR